MSSEKEDAGASKSNGTKRNEPEQSARRTEIKLISVRLKEAALDSPSFRASYNYYSSQVEQIELWIEGLLKSVKKYPQHYTDFKEVNNVLLSQLIPDFLKSTPIDQDNTLSVLECTKMNLDSLWGSTLKDLAINETEITELLTEFSRVNIRSYKDARKNFDFIQSKYDSTLSKFASLSKTKEPSSLREDSFQLHEVRKSYVAASLDICVQTAKFLKLLDTMLIELMDTIYKGRSTYDEKYYLRVRVWSQALTKSIDFLLNDMRNSRNTIERATVAEYEPSRDINDHNPALINPTTLVPTDKATQLQYEKHGWLYMKTTVGKPARTIWVRRWVFVKSGIFGVLLLSPSKTFVQETDKIGVLLANVRYAPEEERRFCFEIKTLENTVMFQAETLKELREWLSVFFEEKQRAIDNASSDAGKYAFGRYPPLLYEFACTSLTSTDVELTTSRAEVANNDDTYTTITSSYLSNLIGQGDNSEFKFSDHAMNEFRDPDVNTPITTSRSKLALISHAFLDPTIVPTAVTANMWGSVNWGTYYMNETKQQKKQKHNLKSLGHRMQYPSYYPAHLRNYDLQLKSLFDSSTDPDELVVLHFGCLWTLNSTQELCGRSFVTTKNCYFFMQSSGFVSLLKKPISDVVAVDVTSERHWEWFKVYDIQGLSMKGRLFLNDAKLIQKKIDLLINNSAKDHPLPDNELIPLMESIETHEPKRGEGPKRAHSDRSSAPVGELSSFQPFNGVSIGGHRMRTNFRDEFDLLEVKEYDAPAKAVFHIMFGDHSSLVRDTLTLVDTDEFNMSPWYSTGKELKRYIDFKMALTKGFLSLRNQDFVPRNCVQTIEEMVDSKYYRVDEERNPYKIPISGDELLVKSKFVIIDNDAKSCKVLFYGTVKSKEDKGNFLTKRVFGKSARHYQAREFKAVVDKVAVEVSKLGSHGQVLKAIRTYGNLSQSEEPFKPKDDLVIILTLRMCIKYYFKLSVFFVSRLIFNLVNLSLNGITQLILMLSMNKVLLAMLIFSLFFNSFLIGRSTFSYWKEKRHEHVMRSLRNDLELTKMERSISLQDMDLLTQFKYNTSSQCFAKFLSSKIADPKGSLADSKFRDTRHEIAVKRNELIVELKILEQVEREIVAGNYNNFVLSEVNLCKVSLGDMGVENKDLEEYCSSCVDEYKKMAVGLL